MSCPTCSHTMHCLGVIGDRVHYHCPRCGTHRISCGWTGTGPVYHDTVPSLVERCRAFAEVFDSGATGSVGANLKMLWRTEGISEAIHTPEDRK